MSNVKPTTEADSVDSVTVTAVVYLPNEEVIPTPAEAAAERVTVRKDGTVAIFLGLFSVETNNNSERQERLASALADLWDTFADAGLLSLTPSDAMEVVVSISLTPLWGQAGISISPSSLQHWFEVGAYLHVNAYSQI